MDTKYDLFHDISEKIQLGACNTWLACDTANAMTSYRTLSFSSEVSGWLNLNVFSSAEQSALLLGQHCEPS